MDIQDLDEELHGYSPRRYFIRQNNTWLRWVVGLALGLLAMYLLVILVVGLAFVSVHTP